MIIPKCNFNVSFGVKMPLTVKDSQCCTLSLRGYQMHKTIKSNVSVIFAVKSAERSLTFFSKECLSCILVSVKSSGSSLNIEVYMNSLSKSKMWCFAPALARMWLCYSLIVNKKKQIKTRTLSLRYFDDSSC